LLLSKKAESGAHLCHACNDFSSTIEGSRLWL
jgi:hypothetical protein